jgi:hypothetical protein
MVLAKAFESWLPKAFGVSMMLGAAINLTTVEAAAWAEASVLEQASV